MNSELRAKLEAEFPEEIKNLWHGSVDCSEGWYELVREALQVLHEHNALPVQIKEKFGTLRVYFDPYSPELYKLIANIEAKSENICDVCGSESAYIDRDRSWWRTRCREHHNDNAK